jgi:hypothetical protein
MMYFLAAQREDTTMTMIAERTQDAPIEVDYPPLHLLPADTHTERRLPRFEARCVHISWQPGDAPGLVSVDTNFEEFVDAEMYLHMLSLATLRLQEYIAGFLTGVMEDRPGVA